MMNTEKEKTILLLEGRNGNAEYMGALLKPHGYIVFSAGSWSDAEKQDTGRSADLLLLDTSLVPAAGSGAGTYTDRILTAAPVIFLFDDDSEIEAVSSFAEKAGTCGYIKRGSGPEHIIAVINTAFKFIKTVSGMQKQGEELEATSEEMQAAIEEMEASNEELLASQKLIEDSERKFRTVFENAPYPMSISDLATGVFIDVNAKFIENVGLSREKIIGHPTGGVINLVRPGDAELMLKELAETGYIRGFQLETENVRGERYEDMLYVYPVEINGVICTVSMMTDIRQIKATERKLLEKERMLAEANNMLRLVIDTLPGHLYWKNKDLRFGGANMRFALDAGLASPDELTGLQAGDISWKDGMIADESEDVEVMRTGNPVMHTVVPYTPPSGGHHWYRKNKIPLKDADGRIIGILCSYDDVTREKLNEDALNESRAQLQGIFDVSMVGVALMRNRRFIRINSALCRTLGYSEDELLNSEARMLYPDEGEYNRVGGELYGRLQKHGQAVVEAKMITKDGRLLDTLISASLVDRSSPESDICASLNDITDLKRAENDARDREERLRAIASSVPGVIYQFYVDENGRYGVSFMSEKAPEMFGITVPGDEFFNEFVSRVHKDDRLRFFDSIKQSVESMTQWKFEGRFVRYTGEVTWFSAMSSPSRQKERIVFNGVIIDITDKKIAEEELSRREDRFRSMIQSSMDLIFILDSNNLLTYESPSVSRILGYDEGFFIGRSPFQLVHQEDLERVMREMSLVYTTENKGVPTAFRFRHADGKWIYLEAIASNLISNPAVNGIVITARDITERKLAGDALRMSEAKFRNIFENMSVGYFRTGLDGSILDVNPACLRILGFDSVADAREFLGNRVANIYADRHDWRTVRDSVMANEDPPIFTVRFKRKNGSEFTAELKMKIVTAADGSNMNVEGLLEDISGRLKTQEILIQSEKMMTVAGLAAGMAHEINNPLGIIMQNAENAMHRLLDELPGNIKAAEAAGIDFKKLGEYVESRRIGQYLGSIREAGARAARIVGNMLQFSRGVDSMYDYLNINTILDKTLDLAVNDYDITKNYDFKKIRIVKRFGNLPDIRCTEIQIEQVFLNILKNAAQAMYSKQYEEGECPEIIITTSLENDSIVITFTDNGPGMDENTRKKIFEPFYTTKQPGSGTGLGLSVSYYIIVNGHGGTITAESSPGNGSSFIITLPARTVNE